MFGVVRAILRSFAFGVAIGVLIAPRPGSETRRMLADRLTNAVNQLLELAALPPLAPDRAATNGHAERPAAKRTRASTDARASS